MTGRSIEVKRGCEGGLAEFNAQSIQGPIDEIEFDRAGEAAGGIAGDCGKEQGAARQEQGEEKNIEADFKAAQNTDNPMHGEIISGTMSSRLKKT
jgi:hypothetical protein